MEEVRPVLHAHDLTEQQWRVMRVVAENGQSDATSIAERSYILAPSLTRILRNLADKGILQTTRDVRDGRRMLIDLTPEGEALIQTVSPQTYEIFEKMRARVGTEKWEQLIALLDEVREEIEQMDAAE